MTFGFLVAPRTFVNSFLFPLRSFGFARMRLNPLSCQNLYHDSVSVIVLRLTSFTENFLICCYQVTRIFLLEVWLRQCVFFKEPLLSWSSCRCRKFGPSGSGYQYDACPIPLFLAALKLTHEKNSRVRPYELEHFHPQDSPSILLTILAGHATGFAVRSLSPFLCVFGFCWSTRRVSPCSFRCHSTFLLMRDAVKELRLRAIVTSEM